VLPVWGQGIDYAGVYERSRMRLSKPVFELMSELNEWVSLGQLQLTFHWKMGHGQLGKSVGSSSEQLVVPNSL
jgi:hypothetical protein